jgi:ribosomal protein S13
MEEKTKQPEPSEIKNSHEKSEKSSAPKQEFKAILRIADKEVKGEVQIYNALARVKGASFMFANAICHVLKLDRSKPAGEFTTEEINKIEEAMRNPTKYNLPKWLLNRNKDPENGDDQHLLSADLDLKRRFDIRRLRKIKCYRGMRHSRGDKKLKVRVRGQRTRSTGRRGKTVGVVRKKK